MPILATIKIEVSEDNTEIRLTAFDLSHGVETRAYVEVISSESSTVCAPASQLLALIRQLNGQLVIETDGTLIRISSLSGEFEIQGMDAEDYPEIGAISTTHRFDGKAVSAAWKYALTSVSGDETKPILQGINMSASGGVLSIASTDGHRLTICKLPIDADIELRSTTIDSKSIASMSRIELGEIELGFDDSTCTIGYGDTIVTRIYESKYPDYQLLIPKVFAITVIVDRDELIKALNIMGSIGNESNLVVVDFSDKGLRLSSSKDTAKGDVLIACELTGEPIKMAFDFRYLLAQVKITPTAKVKLSINTELAPVIITPVDGDVDLLSLVMPVQLRG